MQTMVGVMTQVFLAASIGRNILGNLYKNYRVDLVAMLTVFCEAAVVARTHQDRVVCMKLKMTYKSVANRLLQ